jgi:hypothetical protein
MTKSRQGARRPLTRLAITGLGGHLAFELGAGVGLPGSGVVGAGPSAAAFAATMGAGLHQAGRLGPEADRAFSLVNGFGVAAVTAHLLAWPRRRTRLRLPWLLDCEGLGPELMRWYNPLLYGPGALAALALIVENRSAPSRHALLLAAAVVPLLIPIQRFDFASRQRRATTRPDCWHRRLQPTRPA